MQSVDPRNPPSSPYDDNPAGHYRTLRQGLSLAVGDFDRAAEVQKQNVLEMEKEFDSFRAQNFPQGPPPTGDLPSIYALRNDQLFSPLLAPMSEFEGEIRVMARARLVFAIQHYRELYQYRMIGHVRLGLTYIEQGDIKSAGYHFRQALDNKEGSALLPAQRVARQFLDAIDRANGRRGASP
jgi:tetratricopeptide (TPR) repeat protein